MRHLKKHSRAARNRGAQSANSDDAFARDAKNFLMQDASCS
jgi:hypothetical protein